MLLIKISEDVKLQPRAKLDQGVVDEYAELLKDREFDFPPVVIFSDGKGKNWLADGYHRLAAYRKAGRKKLSAEVNDGDWRDAWLYSLKANTSHGLRRTNADKNRAVKAALADKELLTLGTVKIAELCGVSREFVRLLRKPKVKTPSQPLASGPDQGGNGRVVGDSKSKSGKPSKGKPIPDPIPEQNGELSFDEQRLKLIGRLRKFSKHPDTRKRDPNGKIILAAQVLESLDSNYVPEEED